MKALIGAFNLVKSFANLHLKLCRTAFVLTSYSSSRLKPFCFSFSSLLLHTKTQKMNIVNFLTGHYFMKYLSIIIFSM